MFANSAAVVILGLVIGVPALLLLLWAAISGHFDSPEATAYVIFEEGELSQFRPWETAEQARERVADYGAPGKSPLSVWRKWL